MPQNDVKAVLSRALHDDSFLDLLLTRPESALMGYQLSTNERRALSSRSTNEFSTLFESIIRPEDRDLGAYHRPGPAVSPGHNQRPRPGDGPGPSALTQTEDTGIGASFSKIALAEVVYVKGRQSLLWALM
jgi:hypothetical protein